MTPVVVLCHQVQVQYRLVSLTVREREREEINQFGVYFVTLYKRFGYKRSRGSSRGYNKKVNAEATG